LLLRALFAVFFAAAAPDIARAQAVAAPGAPAGSMAESTLADSMPEALARNAEFVRADLERYAADGSRRRTVTTRDLANAALAELALGADAGRAADYLRRVLAVQDADPASPSYGEVPWVEGPSQVHDPNAIAFAAEPIGPILVGFADRLDPATRDALRARIPAFVAALRRRDAPVSYTNIFLLSATALALLGEAGHDDTVRDDGYARIEQWLSHTRDHGIGEFLSPTYYGVDLGTLVLGDAFCRTPGCRDLFARALGWFWTDIEAHRLGGRIAGPHSRTYDFLRGHGVLDLYLALEHPDEVPLPLPEVDPNSFTRVYPVAAGDRLYRPPAALRRLTDRPRFIEAGVDAQAPDRQAWVGLRSAIGSASIDSGPQDRPIAIDLGLDDELAITIVPEDTGDPYGITTIVGSDGHAKPEHEPLHPTCVQRLRDLFCVLDLDPGHARPGARFTTNVVLPADAAIAADGLAWGPRDGARALPGRDVTLTVGTGGASAALRMVVLDDLGGDAPTLSLRSDEAGLARGAVRLAIEHGAATRAQRHLGVVVLASVADNAATERLQHELAAAPVAVNGTTPGAFSAAATLRGHLLALARSGGHVIERTVDGRPPGGDAYAINGKDRAIPETYV